MGVADLPGQPAVFKPNKWPISPKYALNFIPMFAEPTQGQVKVTENILELIS
jgi:hypothetical protein